MYSNTRVPFVAVPIEDMFYRKIGKIFREFPNVFGTADDIFIVGYDNNSEGGGTI